MMRNLEVPIGTMSSRSVKPDPVALVNRFMSAHRDDVLMRLALGVRKRPGEHEIARRAFDAAETVLAFGVRDRS